MAACRRPTNRPAGQGYCCILVCTLHLTAIPSRSFRPIPERLPPGLTREDASLEARAIPLAKSSGAPLKNLDHLFDADILCREQVADRLHYELVIFSLRQPGDGHTSNRPGAGHAQRKGSTVRGVASRASWSACGPASCRGELTWRADACRRG